MLQIKSLSARIGIEINNAKLDYGQKRGRLEINTQKAQLQIEQARPQVVIDQTIPFAEAGRKTMSLFTQEYVDLGRQHVMQGIARRAQEGDMMARPPYGNAIVQIVMSKLHQPVDYTIGTIPRTKPEIDFVNMEGYISYQPATVESNYTIDDSQFNYRPGGVNVYMERYHELEISFIDTKV